MIEQQQQIDNDEISLKELIQKIMEWIVYLKTQWKIIIGITAIGGIIGFIYASKQQIIYKAQLTFALEEERGSGLGGALGLASNLGFDLGNNAGGAFNGSNLIELLKSRKLIEKTLLSPIKIEGKNTNLANFFIQINSIKKSEKKFPNFFSDSNREKFSLEQDALLFSIYNNVISPNNLIILQNYKKTSIMSIEVKNKNELFAKLFCEKITKEISTYYSEIKSKKAKINMEILQFQTDSIRTELNKAITGVAVASDNIFNLNSAFNIKKTTGTKNQIDVQTNSAILSQLIAQLEIAKVSLRKETPLLQVIDAPILPLEKIQSNKLQFLILGGFFGGFIAIIYVVFEKLRKFLFF